MLLSYSLSEQTNKIGKYIAVLVQGHDKMYG